MTQQMGSASGTAPASRETEVTPGGASELTSEPMTAATSGGASGGTPGVTEADWQEPGSTEPAGHMPAGSEARTADGAIHGTADSKNAARPRNSLRPTAPAAPRVLPIAAILVP